MAEEITRILLDWREGDETAPDRLFPLVYEELKRQARGYLNKERKNHTLQPTALVNEAYLRLVGVNETDWQSRTHFYALAARTMRRILVDHARKIATGKRGGERRRITFGNIRVANEQKAADLLDLDDALKRLERFQERKAKVVEMRFFSGLSQKEIAEVLNITERTVQRDWKFAKLWLYRELSQKN